MSTVIDFSLSDQLSSLEADLEIESKDSKRLLSSLEADLEIESKDSESLLPIFEHLSSTASNDSEPIDRSITLSDSSNSDSLAPLDIASATFAIEDSLLTSQVSSDDLLAATSPIATGPVFRYQNVDFRTSLVLIDDFTVTPLVTAAVLPGTGSVAIEFDLPLMYYDQFETPDPTNDFPAAIGTPSETAGLTGVEVFSFGQSANVSAGAGFYGFEYSVRVTNEEGTFPSSTTFQQAPFVSGEVIISPT